MTTYTHRNAPHSNTYESTNARRTGPWSERLAGLVMDAFMGDSHTDLRKGHPSERNRHREDELDKLAQQLDAEYDAAYEQIAEEYRTLVERVLPGRNPRPDQPRRRAGIMNDSDQPIAIEVVDVAKGRAGFSGKEVRIMWPSGYARDGQAVMRHERFYELRNIGFVGTEVTDLVYDADPNTPVAKLSVPLSVPLAQEADMAYLRGIAEQATWGPITTQPRVQ